MLPARYDDDDIYIYSQNYPDDPVIYIYIYIYMKGKNKRQAERKTNICLNCLKSVKNEEQDRKT